MGKLYLFIGNEAYCQIIIVSCCACGVDVTAPVVVCPSSMAVETARDESVGRADWRVPAAVDNSGYQPSVSVIPVLQPPVMLPIGNHTVTYTAEDSNKNKARCTFTITVTGLAVCLSVPFPGTS